MKPRDQHPDGELQELDHEELPGYRLALYIALAVACAVLVFAFLQGAGFPSRH